MIQAPRATDVAHRRSGQRSVTRHCRVAPARGVADHGRRTHAARPIKAKRPGLSRGPFDWCWMVEGEGFEPSKAVPSDLQSDPFDRSGIPPRDTGRELYTCRRVSQAPAPPRANIAARGASAGECGGNIGECGAITAEDGAIAEKTREIAEKTRATYPPTRAIYPPTREIYPSTRANAKERGAVIGESGARHGGSGGGFGWSLSSVEEHSPNIAERLPWPAPLSRKVARVGR